MNLLKKSLIGAAVCAAFVVSTTAHAGVVIDLFQDPVGSDQTASVATLGGVQNVQNPVAFVSGNVLGQYRDLSIKKLTDTSGNPNTGDARVTAGFGALEMSNASGVKSTGVVTWDGMNNAGSQGTVVNTVGLGGIDLTFGGLATSFLASIQLADVGFEYKITVWDMDGSKSVLSAAVQFPVASTIGAGYDFSWFNLASGTYCNGNPSPPSCTNPLTELDFTITRTGGLIDFTQIGALQLEISSGSTVGVDFTLGSLSTIPEPSALALVGVALLGAGIASRRKAA